MAGFDSDIRDLMKEEGCFVKKNTKQPVFCVGKQG
jgi:hypothetical protein